MAQATTVERMAAGMADEAEGRCSLTCECWDCRSYRRHLLKLAAVVVLACGFAGEVGLRHRLWRAEGEAGPATIELASVAGDADAKWF